MIVIETHASQLCISSSLVMLAQRSPVSARLVTGSRASQHILASVCTVLSTHGTMCSDMILAMNLSNTALSCALQLNKRSLLVLKLSHGKASNDDALSANDNTQRVVKTYHALDLRAVRYCTRCAKTRNAFEVCTADGGKVRVRVEDADVLEQWMGALRHNMAFLR